MVSAAAIDRRPSPKPRLAAILPPLAVAVLVVVNGWSVFLSQTGHLWPFDTAFPLADALAPDASNLGSMVV